MIWENNVNFESIRRFFLLCNLKDTLSYFNSFLFFYLGRYCYHLNYSPKNKNEKIFAQYGNPGEKFGYPVFIVLDKNGKQIHTQESGSLEEGKGYSLDKVKAFFEDWKPKK